MSLKFGLLLIQLLIQNHNVPYTGQANKPLVEPSVPRQTKNQTRGSKGRHDSKEYSKNLSPSTSVDKY